MKAQFGICINNKLVGEGTLEGPDKFELQCKLRNKMRRTMQDEFLGNFSFYGRRIDHFDEDGKAYHWYTFTHVEEDFVHTNHSCWLLVEVI